MAWWGDPASRPVTARLPLGSLAAGLLGTLCFAQPIAPPGALEGRALHAETGRGLRDVTIVVASRRDAEHRREATTDAEGRFFLPDLPAGPYELTASAVGFGWMRKVVEIPPGETATVEIYLAPGTAVREDLVVTARSPSPAPSLSGTELHVMKTVLMDDPLRAFQQLPAFISNDDFNTGFAYQGSGFDRIGILLDGVPLRSFSHTIAGLDDTGSTSILSADLIDRVEIVGSGDPGRLGNLTTGGYLDLRTRIPGPRRRALLSVSGTALLALAEGPAGAGTWVASFRKSYVDWLVRKIDPESGLNFGFYDVFAKYERPVGRKHQFGLRFLQGETGMRDAAEGGGMNSVDRGRFANSLVAASWLSHVAEGWTVEGFLYYQAVRAKNRNRWEAPLWRNDEDVAGVRVVTTGTLRPGLELSFGGRIEHWSGEHEQRLYDFRQERWFVYDRFRAEANLREYFATLSWAPVELLRVAGGWTQQFQGNLRQSVTGPALLIQFAPRVGRRFWAGWSQSGQFPFPNQLYGRWANPALAPEKARTWEAGWELQSSGGWGVELRAYDRYRWGVPWQPHGLWRLAGGAVVPPRLEPFSNSLEDRTRGFQVRLSRWRSDGLTGWIAYSRNRSRWSEEPGTWCPGNYDQPQALGIFLTRRVGPRLDVTCKWKLADGLPLRAYARRVDGKYYLAESRNQERLPRYSRLDLRVGRSFDRERYRLTLFFEVLNLTNRENLRFAGHDINDVDPGGGRIHGLVQKQLPILPTAGLVLEW